MTDILLPDLIPATDPAPAFALTATSYLDMVRHWLTCPVGDYYGSDYGNPLLSLLHEPLHDGSVFVSVLAKLKADVRPLADLGPQGVRIEVYPVPGSNDRRDFAIVLAGIGTMRLSSGEDGQPVVMMG